MQKFGIPRAQLSSRGLHVETIRSWAPFGAPSSSLPPLHADTLPFPSQVLQKLGKTVETKDEQFEQSAYNFQLQQVAPGSRGGRGEGDAPCHPPVICMSSL